MGLSNGNGQMPMLFPKARIRMSKALRLYSWFKGWRFNSQAKNNPCS